MKTRTIIVLGLFFVQILAAVFFGPYSCEWGNEYYFFTGLACLLTMILIMLLQRQWDVLKRLGYAVLFSFGSLVVWFLGLLLGDFQLLCRLF